MNKKKKNFVVTGGTGFIGQVCKLLIKNYNLKIFDNNSRKQKNLKVFKKIYLKRRYQRQKYCYFGRRGGSSFSLMGLNIFINNQLKS